MSTLRRISVGILLLTGAFAAGACKKSCSDGGQEHADGTSWECADGCNSCTCTDGVVGSTLMACGAADAGFPLPDAEPTTPVVNPPSSDAAAVSGDASATTDASAGSDAGASADAGAVKGCGARLGDTCTEDEYCAYTLGQLCGQADATAKCLPRPEVCPEIYKPICGCDGDTYGNDCEAARAGTGVMKKGECPN